MPTVHVKDPQRPAELTIRLGFLLGAASVVFGGWDILLFIHKVSFGRLGTGLLGLGMAVTGLAAVWFSILIGKGKAPAVRPMVWACGSNIALALIELVIEFVIGKKVISIALLSAWLIADTFVLIVLRQALANVQDGSFNTIPGTERIAVRKRPKS